MLNTKNDEFISVAILRLSQHHQGFCATRLHTSTVGNMKIAPEISYYCYIPVRPAMAGPIIEPVIFFSFSAGPIIEAVFFAFLKYRRHKRFLGSSCPSLNR